MYEHWKTYYCYQCEHVLCNAHHLRELTFVEEEYNQHWSGKMKQCLQGIKMAVNEAISSGKESLTAPKIVGFKHCYDGILCEARQETPILAKPEHKSVGQ